MLKGKQEKKVLLNTRVTEQLLRLYVRNDLSLIDVFNNPEDSY